LENKYGVGLVAVAKAIANKAIDSSVDYTAYQGYHLLSSDSIDYVGVHSAFRIFAQNDARNEPIVVIIDEEQEEKERSRINLPIKSSIQMNSPNPVANGILSIFSPAILILK
jgi:hypothetical protein